MCFARQSDASVAAAGNPGQEVEPQRVRHPGVHPGSEMAESIKNVWVTGSGPGGRTVGPRLPDAHPFCSYGGRLLEFILARVRKRGRKQGNFSQQTRKKRYPGKSAELSLLDDHFLSFFSFLFFVNKILAIVFFF